MTGVGRLHTQAILQLLHGIDGVTVYDGKVDDNPTFPYTVLHPDPGTKTRSGFNAVSDQVTTRFQTTSVGETRDQAAWAHDKVDAALADVSISTITGRNCWPISQDAAQPVRRDDEIKPPRFYAVAQWRLASVPAA